MRAFLFWGSGIPGAMLPAYLRENPMASRSPRGLQGVIIPCPARILAHPSPHILGQFPFTTTRFIFMRKTGIFMKKTVDLRAIIRYNG